MYSRRLQDVLIKTNIFALLIRLQKTSARRLDQDQYIRLDHMYSRRLQDFFKTSSRRFATTCLRRFQEVFKMFCKNVYKTSSRRLQDVLKMSSRNVQGIFKTSCKDVFKTFSRRIIKLNCLPGSRICLGYTSEKFMVSVENLHVR